MGFFQLQDLPADQIKGYYDLKLVIVSYIVAVFASYVALDIAWNLRNTRANKWNYASWLLGGSLAMGLGIWTMHFIGMEAFIMPMVMTYDPFLTFFSLVIAVLASGFALFKVTRTIALTNAAIFISACLMGLGIASMHYVGMAAMQHIHIRYIPSLFFLSIAIAIFASLAAIWLLIKTYDTRALFRFNFFSALIMGAAICGMHYVGMFASVMTPDATIHDIPSISNPLKIHPLFIGTTTFLIMLIFFVLSTNRQKFVLTLQRKNENLLEKEKELSNANETLNKYANYLLDKERKTSAILTAAADGIISFNEDKKIEMANIAANNIFGYERDELVGKSISDVVALSNISAETFFTGVIASEKSPIELIGIKKNGDLFYCELAFSKLKLSQGTSYIMVIRDISERKSAKIKLEEINLKLMNSLTELEDARNKAESANVAKTNFLANMSHEIRTPLNVIIGTAALLSRSELGIKEKKYANRIYLSSQTLLKLITDILDFSKIESGEITLDTIPCNFTNLVKEVIETFEERAEEKHLKMIVELMDEKEANIISDPLRIKQLLINLIGNAIKFTDKGFIKIHSSSQPLNDSQILIRLTIEDTGIGIERKDFKSIFKKFSQADTSSTRRFGGAGLGLAISKEIAELLGGTINFESRFGKGSTFWFEIPFLMDKEPETKK